MGEETLEIPTAAEVIRQRIGELRFAIRELEDVLVITGDLEPEEEEEETGGSAIAAVPGEWPPAPKAKAARTAPTAAAAGKPARENAATRALRLIGAAGPLTATAVAAKTGDAVPTVSYALRASPWFERADPANRKSPVRLTQAGLAAWAELERSGAAGAE